MKKKILIGLTLAILSLFVVRPIQAEVYTLWVGQHIDVGMVIIENDSNTLYVTFEISGECELVETHVHAAIDPAEKRLYEAGMGYNAVSKSDIYLD